MPVARARTVEVSQEGLRVIGREEVAEDVTDNFCLLFSLYFIGITSVGPLDWRVISNTTYHAGLGACPHPPPLRVPLLKIIPIRPLLPPR